MSWAKYILVAALVAGGGYFAHCLWQLIQALQRAS